MSDHGNSTQMLAKVIAILRTLLLVILSGGAIGVVFSAVVLVKAATAEGIPVAVAANTNAPVFIAFGKLAIFVALSLLVAEGIDFATNKDSSKLTKWRRIFALISSAFALVFALGITPPMETLRVKLKTDEAARVEFHKLHEVSRVIFSIMIFFALASLVLSNMAIKPKRIEG
jgi:hypothetical protein